MFCNQGYCNGNKTDGSNCTSSDECINLICLNSKCGAKSSMDIILAENGNQCFYNTDCLSDWCK